MFNDFWQMCQKFWIVEDDDAYWFEFLYDARKFADRHKTPFAKQLCLAFADYLDSETQKKFGNGGPRKIETWEDKK